MYALRHAPIISKVPATKPAVKALAKNDFLIKKFWFPEETIDIG
jgi:hypothetical protein